MFVYSIVAVAIAIAASVSAQVSTSNSTIDPTSVDLTLRSQWCSAQLNTCGTLCSGDTDTDTCDQNTLTFNCTCTSNGSAPGLIYYQQTMPTFICEQNFNNCITQNVGIAASQAKCNADEKANCGHLDPTKFVPESSSSSSASSAPTSTSASAGSAPASTSASSSSSKAAGATMMPRAEYGAGMVAAGIAFGLIL